MKKIDEFFKQCELAREFTEAPGLAVGLILDNKKYTRAFGIETASTPEKKLSPDSVFATGSLTKTFCSNIMYQLHLEGKLNIDDPVSEYLPQFQAKTLDGYPGQLTLRCFLSHSSGFRDNFEMFPKVIFGKKESIVECFNNEPPMFPVGTWNYCNTGFILLGHVLEKVMGRNLQDVYRQRVFEPLGFTSTFSLEKGGYSGSGRDVDGHQLGFNRSIPITGGTVNANNIAGSLGVLSSVRDLTEYTDFWLEQFRNQGSHLPSKENLTHLCDNFASVGSYIHSMGGPFYRLENENIMLYSSHGESNGQYTSYAFCPELDFGFVVLCNLSLSEFIYKYIRQVVFKHFFDIDWKPVEAKKQNADKGAAGTYQLFDRMIDLEISDEQEVVVSHYKPGLNLGPMLSPKEYWSSYEPDHYYFQNSNIHNNSLDFIRNNKGDIQWMRYRQDTFTKIS